MRQLEQPTEEHGASKITETEKRKLESLGLIDALSKIEKEQQTLTAKRDAAKQLLEGAKTAFNKEHKECSKEDK